MIIAFKRGRDHNWSLLLKLCSSSSGPAWPSVMPMIVGQVLRVLLPYRDGMGREDQTAAEQRSTKQGRHFFSPSLLGILQQDLLFC